MAGAMLDNWRLGTRRVCGLEITSRDSIEALT